MLINNTLSPGSSQLRVGRWLCSITVICCFYMSETGNRSCIRPPGRPAVCRRVLGEEGRLLAHYSHCTRRHTHGRTRTHRNARTQTQERTHAPIWTRTCTQERTHGHTQTDIHTRAHAHTHTHTHRMYKMYYCMRCCFVVMLNRGSI